jgi:hypothetical protein
VRSDLMKFVLGAGLLFFAAWLAGTGHVAYTMIMLLIAAALAYAIVDLVGYEMRKKRGVDRRA